MEISDYHPFKSAQAKEEYLACYDRRAKSWPIPSETRMVDTSFGKTFVRISGPEQAPPLVLLPGSVFNSLMWLPNIQALSKEYRTYAVDNIYDCGRSIYTRDLKMPNDFTLWLDELFTALNLDNNINLMGLSYGSWLTNLYALHAPQRLSKIVLLAHPAIVSVNAGFIFRFLLCFFSPKYLANFFEWLFQDTAQKSGANRKLVDDVIEEMQLAARCFKPKGTVTPKIMKDEELKNIQVPALFLFGENEKTFSSPKALQRLNMVAPKLRAEIHPKAGHDLNFAQDELVNEKVVEFLDDNRISRV